MLEVNNKDTRTTIDVILVSSYVNLNIFFFLLCNQKISKDCTIIQRRIKIQKRLYHPFLYIGSNCLEATEPLLEDRLLLTTKFPGLPGTHFIDLERIKG